MVYGTLQSVCKEVELVEPQELHDTYTLAVRHLNVISYFINRKTKTRLIILLCSQNINSYCKPKWCDYVIGTSSVNHKIVAALE